MAIEITLLELRQLEALAEKAKVKAKAAIDKEQHIAWRFFEYLDQIPEGWPQEYGECDDFCRRCIDKIMKKPTVKKLLESVPNWDGPRDYSGEEGESSRNCLKCGCPLPWALLDYGMESELSHFESNDPTTANCWYWLHTLAEECLGCEEYLNIYGQRVRRILVGALLGKNHHSYTNV